ncbi:hypothetical protein D3C71_2234280 [compost metagenome]
MLVICDVVPESTLISLEVDDVLVLGDVTGVDDVLILGDVTGVDDVLVLGDVTGVVASL